MEGEMMPPTEVIVKRNNIAALLTTAITCYKCEGT